MPVQRVHLYNYTLPELAELIAAWGYSPVHAGRVWRYLYRAGVASLMEMRELPRKLQAKLQEETSLAPLEQVREVKSSDGFTQKYLLGLYDGQTIETVLMRFRDRVTACLSSQAGCALGCVFCATGQSGFSRNLTTGEIVSQAMFVDRVLRECASGNQSARLRNLVLMGMGEPLLNYEPVMNALDILRRESTRPENMAGTDIA